MLDVKLWTQNMYAMSIVVALIHCTTSGLKLSRIATVYRLSFLSLPACLSPPQVFSL